MLEYAFSTISLSLSHAYSYIIISHLTHVAHSQVKSVDIRVRILRFTGRSRTDSWASIVINPTLVKENELCLKLRKKNLFASAPIFQLTNKTEAIYTHFHIIRRCMQTKRNYLIINSVRLGLTPWSGKHQHLPTESPRFFKNPENLIIDGKKVWVPLIYRPPQHKSQASVLKSTITSSLSLLSHIIRLIGLMFFYLVLTIMFNSIKK